MAHTLDDAKSLPDTELIQSATALKGVITTLFVAHAKCFDDTPENMTNYIDDVVMMASENLIDRDYVLRDLNREIRNLQHHACVCNCK